MHMCDICCVETICGSIFGDYRVIFYVCTFRTVLFTVVIMLKFL
jgi:hypothetical protein